MSRQVHIISHSHWDREWHQTFQQFRLRLVRLIDDLLAVLAAEPGFAYFMLDGQTILLEDYAEVRPERVDELREHIRSSRILIGPWYVHPDEFLVSGEAIVRNLQIGARLCSIWGGRMAVGYVPDQFGHIAQLPQIWLGFGIDTSVLWRGVDRAVGRTAFKWQGHDGSTVLVAMLPDGYSHAEWLPTAGRALAERLRVLCASLEALSTEEQPLLIMNGGDHVSVQAGLWAGITAAQEAQAAPYTLLHSTLPAYIAALKAAGEPATVLHGELRSPRSAFLLPGVLSSRIWIKQRNAAAQLLLERQAEPLATIAAALGDRYPDGELQQSWRYLLQNQPHDSVCGCSIDQVHREMVTRYDWSEQIAQELCSSAIARLAARVDSVIPGAEDPHTLAITVYNGAPAAQGGRIDVRVHLAGEAESYELVDSNGKPVPHTWLGEHGESPTIIELPREEVPDLETIMAQVEGNRVLGLGILAVSMRTIGDALQVEVTIGDQALLSRDEIEEALRDALDLAESAGSVRAVGTIHRSTELHLAALAPEVDACGYRTLLLRPRGKRPIVSAHQPAAELLPVIENERYRIEADPSTGALTLTERAGGMRLGPANIFLDGGDAGDLYTYCAPANDNLLSSTAASPEIEREVGPLGQTLRIRQVLHVPRELADSRYERSGDRVALPIETAVTVAPGDPLVRIHTTVDNQAKDHRLRVHVVLPFAADHAHAEDAFAMVRRAAQPDNSGDWAEQPVGTAPHQGVLAVHDATRACLLAARGLPEYEVLPRPDGTAEIALTLLRCTGWLSRSDIATRPGDAGPALPTPEAQCLGRHTFEYALAFGTQPWRALLPAARTFAVPLRAYVAPCAEGSLPAMASLVAVRPAAIVLSALKGAEDGRGAIMRVYNDDVTPHRAEIALLLPVRRATLVSLAEVDVEVLFEGEERKSFSVDIPPGRIVSLRLEWGEIR